MKHWTRVAAIAALFIATGSLAADAQARTIRVRLDNLLTPSQYDEARTTNQITVGVRFTPFGSFTNATPRALNSLGNSHDFIITTSGLDAYDVVQVAVSINGTNLFIADQVELFDDVGNLVDRWGVDNEIGYCLSTETADFSNSHCLSTFPEITHFFTVE